MDNNQINLESISERQNSFRLWYAVIIFIIANLVSALPVGFVGDKVFYNNFEQPQFSPPDWLFAPMWFFLNITSLIALSIVANSSEGTVRRRAFLILEAIGWVLFAIFTTLYFWMRSPILGAVDTVAGLAVGFASLVYCSGIDRRAAFFILLRVLWLCLASYVSVYIAFHNTDGFFRSISN
jgi:tryptophan-rich sensory protein